jgi:hypothetical protein
MAIAEEGGLKYALSQTIASWVAALSVLLAALTLMNERIQRVRKRDTGRVAADPNKMGYFFVGRVSWGAALIGRETEEPTLPTITGLIEAGDAGLWTSAALDQLLPYHGEICWVALFRSVFKQAVEKSENVEGKLSVYRKAALFVERAREHVVCERIAYGGLKEEWSDREQKLRQKMTRAGQQHQQPATGPDALWTERITLEQDRVFPLRSLLYRPEAAEVGAQERQGLSLRMLAALPSYLARETDANGLENQAPAPNIQPPPGLVDCARPLETIPVVMRQGAGQEDDAHSYSSADGAFPEMQPIVNRQQRPIDSQANSPSGSSLSIHARRFIRRSSSSLGTFGSSRSSRRSTWNNHHQQDEDLLGRSDTGLNNVRPAWILDSKPCIETSREELAALALVLGMQLKVNESSNTVSGIGAFGTSLYAAQTGGYWKLHLVHGSRIPKHLKSQGSGYTTLMAKHIACGSIPFADSSLWVASIYCTDNVLGAIKRGNHIQDTQAYGGPSLEYLRRLPAEKQIDAFYGVAGEQVVAGMEGIPFGAILKASGQPVGRDFTWPRAVVGIAFGGLVPQATPRVAEAVRFTVAGRYRSVEAIGALEELIDKLHGMDQQWQQLFGPYVAMRVEAHKGVDNVNYTTPSRSPSRDSAATFGRYMNLLERIVACADVPNGDRVHAVYEATCGVVESEYRSAVERWNSRSTSIPEEDLGTAIKGVTENLNDAAAIPLDHCAAIVRCILAVWAEQVPHINLEEFRRYGIAHQSRPVVPGRDGHSDHSRSTDGSCWGSRIATLEDLPAISALG